MPPSTSSIRRRVFTNAGGQSAAHRRCSGSPRTPTRRSASPARARVEFGERLWSTAWSAGSSRSTARSASDSAQADKYTGHPAHPLRSHGPEAWATSQLRARRRLIAQSRQWICWSSHAITVIDEPTDAIDLTANGVHRPDGRRRDRRRQPDQARTAHRRAASTCAPGQRARAPRRARGSISIDRARRRAVRPDAGDDPNSAGCRRSASA